MRWPRSTRVLALTGLLVVVVLAWLGPLGGFVTRERGVVTANPGLRPYASVVQLKLKPGQEACVKPVPFEEDTGKATFAVLVAPSKRPAPPLEVIASAPGYTATATLDEYPVTNRPEPVAVELDEPPRDVLGQLCWRNAGERAIAIIGTDEPKSVGPAETRIDGELQIADAQLQVGGRESRSLVSRTGQLVSRAADLSGGLPAFVLWIVLLVVVLGFPAGTAYTFWATTRSGADAEAAGAGVPDPVDDGPDRVDPPPRP